MTRRHQGETGASLIEALLVLGIAMTTASVSLPAFNSAVSSSRGRQAAAFVAGQLRATQLQAVRSNRSAALVFDLVGGRWQFRLCTDGNGNGVRRAEISSAIDPCVAGPTDIQPLFPDVSIAVDPELRGPEGEAGSSDPVRFGASDIASFSPGGTGSSGSLFLRSTTGQHFLIRVTGVTGRTRMLRHDPEGAGWEDL